MTKLREVAHSRTGDKGNISNISLIAYRIEEGFTGVPFKNWEEK